MYEATLRHQKTMLALRREMGWPLVRPANNGIAFSSGRLCDFEVGTELGRIATALNQDIIYSGWDSIKATQPKTYTIAYRDLFSVDIADKLVPYAANDQAPIMLVSTRRDEAFCIDRRGTLIRLDSKPRDLGKGRRLAAKRLKTAFAEMRNEVLPDNRHIPWGTDRIEQPLPATETVVRFA